MAPKAKKRNHDNDSIIFDLVFHYIEDPRVLALCCLVCSEWEEKINSSASLWRPFTIEKTHSVNNSECQNESSTNQIIASAIRSVTEPSSVRQMESNFFSVKQIKIPESKRTNLLKEADLVWNLKMLALDAEQKNRFHVGRASVRSICGHTDSVTCCKMRNGTVVSGSADETVRVWNLASGACKMTLNCDSKFPVLDVDFDDAKILASCGSEVCIWRRKDGKLLRRIGGHFQKITSMIYDDTDLFLGCVDGSVRFFDIYSSNCSKILKPHTKHVSCLFFSPETKTIVSGSKDGSLKMHNVSSSDLICSINSSHGVQCLQANIPSNKLFVGYANGELVCYDLRSTHDPLACTTLSPFGLTSVHFQPYGQSTLLASDKLGHLFVVQSSNLECVRSFLLPKLPIAKRSVISPLVSDSIFGSDHAKFGMGDDFASINCVGMGLTRAVTANSNHTIAVWNFGSRRT